MVAASWTAREKEREGGDLEVRNNEDEGQSYVGVGVVTISSWPFHLLSLLYYVIDTPRPSLPQVAMSIADRHT